MDPSSEIKDNRLDEHRRLKDENTDFIYRINILILCQVFVAVIAGLFFSMTDGESPLVSVIFLLLFVLAFITTLFLSKRLSVHSTLSRRINFLIGLAALLVVQYFSRAHGILVISALYPCFSVLMFANNSRLFSYIFSGLYLSLVLFNLITLPRFTFTVTPGFYVIVILTAVAVVIAGSKGIEYFKRHEDFMLLTIDTIKNQVAEIRNLNHQSDKIRERLESVMQISEDGIIDFDLDHNVVQMSPRGREILGFNSKSPDEFKDKLVSNLEDCTIDDFNLIWDDFQKSGRHSTVKECFYNLSDSPRRLKFSFLSFKSEIDAARHMLLVIKDVTKEFEQGKEIYEYAYSDSLTGLKNRHALVDFIENHRKQYFVSCVAILDIDNFRFYNDSFGYHTGDRILIEIGKMLESSDESYIKAVGRLGGNDFALYLDTVVDEQQFFLRIQEKFNRIFIDDIEIRLNFSIGIAYISDSDNSGDGLIKKAEIAMYKAKERGKKGICVYSEDLDDEMQRRLAIMGELEDAIANKEFYLNFQPKVDSTRNRVIGFEALVRWQSPRLGFVPPDEFISLAEQSGLINSLGEFIIEESCRFLQSIRSRFGEKEDFRVSINVSAVQLLNSGFYDSFFRILETMEIPASMVGIEITETAVMENISYVSHQLQRFRDQGIVIYLDDFGTGYSSLNYLTRLPIDIMKVDKSFVDRIQEQNREHEVVRLIVSLADTFSFNTIAEGVEEKEQLDALKEMGCHIFQGYYFSKPLQKYDALTYMENFDQS